MTDRFLGTLYRHAPAPLDAADHVDGRLLLAAAWRESGILGKRGNGRISGQVTVIGQPAARKVRLFDLATGLLVDEAWSAADGSYQFEHIDRRRRYLVVAHDHLEQYNAAVADLVEAELMP